MRIFGMTLIKKMTRMNWMFQNFSAASNSCNSFVLSEFMVVPITKTELSARRQGGDQKGHSLGFPSAG